MAKEEFRKVVERLGFVDDPHTLQMLTGIARSSIFKYMSDTESAISNIPASALNLVKLLLLVKTYDPELFVTWGVLQQTPDEVFYKALEDMTLTEKIESLKLLKVDREKLLR